MMTEKKEESHNINSSFISQTITMDPNLVAYLQLQGVKEEEYCNASLADKKPFFEAFRGIVNYSYLSHLIIHIPVM